MEYKEFSEEGTVLKNLEADFIPLTTYQTLHESSVIVCHDVFISCTHKDNQGILLVKRLQHPAKDRCWPIGGRIQRGLSAELSLINKAKDECGLELENISFLGVARTFFKKDPFNHNKGTDTLNLAFYAESSDKVKLNHAHADPIFVTQKSYLSLRPDLDEYVVIFLDTLSQKGLLK